MTADVATYTSMGIIQYTDMEYGDARCVDRTSGQIIPNIHGYRDTADITLAIDELPGRGHVRAVWLISHAAIQIIKKVPHASGPQHQEGQMLGLETDNHAIQHHDMQRQKIFTLKVFERIWSMEH